MVFNQVNIDQIKRGDHIYTWRIGYAYSHHGIYCGENKVIHFTCNKNASSGSGLNLSSSVVSSSCINCTCEDSESGQNYDSTGSFLSRYACGSREVESGVTISCLKCFTKTGSLYLYKYGVKKLTYVSRQRGGTCTTAPSDSPDDVIDRATYLYLHGFGKYNLRKNNCEDFALYCKTGLLVPTGSSGQVHFFNASCRAAVVKAFSGAQLLIICATALSPAAPGMFVAGGAVIATMSLATAVGSHYVDKYRGDIGVRRDAVKVRMEDVTLFR